METNALTFPNLEKAINDFVSDFVDTYKGLLIRDNKKATGDLIRSIKPIEIQFETNNYSGSISLAYYWKYVEYGRRPGKFPPQNKILDWIKIKPVIPRPINGIKPTEKQLTFLISRKIARDGIEAGNQFKEALDLCWTKNKNKISDAISIDLQSNIDLIKI